MAATLHTLSSPVDQSLFHPTEEHHMLREMVADFARKEVGPQAEAQDLKGGLNLPLFRQLGELGLLGITIPEEHGGSGMDTVAAVIAHEELSRFDPGFCLAYLAHAMLFVNNFFHSGSPEQVERWLPAVISGERVGGMGMTEELRVAHYFKRLMVIDSQFGNTDHHLERFVA